MLSALLVLSSSQAFAQDLDTDGDGISNSIDQCPTHAETVNNYQDLDGCPDVVPPKDTQNDEISFSGVIGPMINCEVFSYRIDISIDSETDRVVIIEIIDPDGNVAGTDAFDSNDYDSTRIIEMNWGKDGRYLIQVHYNGYTYQEDFSYDKKSPESFQSYRFSCLKEKYVEPIQKEPSTWFNFEFNYRNANFLHNAKILEELLYDYDPDYFVSHYADFVSVDVINSTIVETNYSGNLEKTLSVTQELRTMMPDLIGKSVDSVYKKGEEHIINSDILLDEKTDLIFELRKHKEGSISVQTSAAEKYIDLLESVFQNFHNFHDRVKIAAQKDKEYRESVAEGIAKEKEIIRHEITNAIPKWVKTNADQWSDEQIDDDSFVQGIHYLIQEKIIIPPTTQGIDTKANEIPEWVKNNAKWWSENKLTNYDFIKGIEYLLQKGIIKIN